MTHDDIIRMAREAGINIKDNPEKASGVGNSIVSYYDLKRFAALVAAAEREACAVTAWSAGMDCHNKALGLPCDARNVGSLAASAIRARSQA